MSQSLAEVRRSPRTRKLVTSSSRVLAEKARLYFPSGSTRAPFHRSPYPLYMRKAKGCEIWDVDGNRFIDFVNNMGPLVLGHGHPQVMKAVSEQVASFWCGAPTELEVKLAEKILREFPTGDKLLFCASGSEAAMKLVRAARASSGKKKVAISTGAFHGTSDSVSPGVGVPDELSNLVLRFRYNDEDSFVKTVESAKNELAAVVVEAILGQAGSVPATRSFIRSVREVTERYGIHFILDEVVTGFRLSRGGLSELYRVKPDGVILGKIIGGGFPVGALLGRSELMREFQYTTGRSPMIGRPRILHGGTFNAHPVTMAAGLATLDVLTRDAYSHLQGLGESVRKILRRQSEEERVSACVTGIGSVFHLRFTPTDIKNYESSQTADERRGRKYDLLMLQRGINLAPYHGSFCSLPMGRKEIEEFGLASAEAIPLTK